jgi:hypothetical protein
MLFALLVIAGFAAVWQIYILASGIAIQARGDRVTSMGIGPGLISVILLIVWGVLR